MQRAPTGALFYGPDNLTARSEAPVWDSFSAGKKMSERSELFFPKEKLSHGGAGALMNE